MTGSPTAADANGALAMELGVVVLTYGSLDPGPVIQALGSVGVPGASIVVVQNPSGRPEDAPTAPSGVELLPQTSNIGYGAGMNVGIRYWTERGRGALLLVTPDIELDPQSLIGAVRHFSLHPDIGILGPVIEGPRGEFIFSGGGTLNARFDVSHDGSPRTVSDTVRDVDWVDGTMMLVRSEVGLLPDDYFLYWEDIAYSLQAQGVGFRTCVQDGWRVQTTPGARNRSDLFRYLFWRNRIASARRLGTPMAWAYSVVRLVGACVVRSAQAVARDRDPRSIPSIVRTYGSAGWRGSLLKLGPPPSFTARGSGVDVGQSARAT